MYVILSKAARDCSILSRGSRWDSPSAAVPERQREAHISDTAPCFQRCISPRCGATYAIDEVRVACPRCGNLLDVAYDWHAAARRRNRSRAFEAEMVAGARSALLQRRVAVPRVAALRAAGAVRHRGRRPDAAARVGRRRPLRRASRPGRLHLQYEGLNPSGSFKDNGMSAAFSHARLRRRHAGPPAPRPATPAPRWPCTARSRG